MFENVRHEESTNACSNLDREGRRFYGTAAVGSQRAFTRFRKGNKVAVLAVEYLDSLEFIQSEGEDELGHKFITRGDGEQLQGLRTWKGCGENSQAPHSLF